ncbi:MAG: 5-bromo-4-chloroindolyl phosphate hydrolysis family protein [Pseudomonadota bacterium]
MAAQRYGGEFSPKGGASTPSGGGDKTPAKRPNKFRGKTASSVDVRTVLMFILPTPLLLGALGSIGDGAAISLILYLFAYAVLMLGAWLTREGQRATDAYNARTIAKPPAFPRKLCGAGLTGFGVAAASVISTSGAAGFLENTGNMITALLFGGLATGLHVVSFGLDPMKSKGITDAIAQAELERVADALDKAESKLKTIETLAHTLRDREIDDRVTTLNATVRDMIKIVEQDPRDLSRARRYLGVYLKGAEDATQKYADNHERLNDPKLRTDYLDLLTDLEQSFSRGKESLLLDDRTDLEVEIEVLRERLGQENA